MTTEEQTNQILNAKLEALELESRRVLRAMRWSTRVRLILVLALLVFVIVFSLFFYRLYTDIRDRRVAEVQRIINERPEEFSEPLTRQLIQLAEGQGPYIGTVFREQIEKDSQKYVDAFDDERDVFITNMQTMLEGKLNAANAAVMEEHETILRREFPELMDDRKLELIKSNMEEIYTQVGKRYYVDFMGDRLKSIVSKLDTFPAAKPRQPGAPLSEQLASEMLELVRMMVIYSENYVPPEVEERIPPQINSAANIKETPDDKSANVSEAADKEDGNPADKENEGSTDETEDDGTADTSDEDGDESGDESAPDDEGDGETDDDDSNSGDDG